MNEPIEGPMLTDKYQLTMAYAYWKCNRHNDPSVFDVFFRKNPFGGEMSVFAGLNEVLDLVKNFKFTDSDIEYLSKPRIIPVSKLQKDFRVGVAEGWIRSDNESPTKYSEIKYSKTFEDLRWEPVSFPMHDLIKPAPMAGCDPKFFDWLQSTDCSQVTINSLKEGSVCFPRIPLMTIQGPLAIVQLLETPILNIVNYASLMATNASRFRLASGYETTLMEFGLRRAQGKNGGFAASHYSILGGFDATSNVLAGKLLDVPISGTHAHAFVSSFVGLEDLDTRELMRADGIFCPDFVSIVMRHRENLGYTHTNIGELTAFIAYAQAFPSAFLALVDTYNTLHSGIPNFLCVAMALLDCGYEPIGIRLDSGDLPFLSKEAVKMFHDTRDLYHKRPEQDPYLYLINCKVVASNDIDEQTIYSFKEQYHKIDVFGIGTHLVTCKQQPAFGGVYKLVECKFHPRIKLSEETVKITLPGLKRAYRLYEKTEFFGLGMMDTPKLDLLIASGEPEPVEGQPIKCYHPFDKFKNKTVTPSKVVSLHKIVWDGIEVVDDSLEVAKKRAAFQLATLRPDHVRALNATPYKVSVTKQLFETIEKMRAEENPDS